MGGKEKPSVNTWGEVVRERSWKPTDYILTYMFPTRRPLSDFLARVSSHSCCPEQVDCLVMLEDPLKWLRWTASVH